VQHEAVQGVNGRLHFGHLLSLKKSNGWSSICEFSMSKHRRFFGNGIERYRNVILDQCNILLFWWTAI